MKIIKKIVERIDEELCDAQRYAEMSVEEKAFNNTSWAEKFHTLAEDELRHSMVMHQYAVEKIEKLKTVYQPSQKMMDKWDKAHKEYIDKSAWIKQMLSM